MKYTPTYYLAYPEYMDMVLVRGTECTTREQALTLISERKANGQAFAGECVVKVQIQDA